MKNKRLLRTLGDIDSDLIEEAAPAAIPKSSRRSALVKWLSAAACVCLLAAGTIGVMRLTDNSERTPDTPQWPTKKIIAEGTTQSSELAIIPRWNEMTINVQFGEVAYNSARYSTRASEISVDHIGKKLGEAVLKGYDIYEDKEHTTNASLYTINTISEECAIALQFEGHTDYYVYVNSFYRPATLGEFIDKLNLRELLSTGSVWYNYWKDPENHTGYTQVEFTDLQTSVVWDMLLTDTSLENVHSDQAMYLSAMGVSVDIPLLGYENIGIWVTEEGYVVTNILDTGKAFYIGPEKVTQFIDYVKKNCTGYEIIFQYDEDTANPEGSAELELIVEQTSNAMPPKTDKEED